MCGIIGIVATQDVAGALYDGLTVLQHRGQDAAGIATADGAHLRVHKGNGLVRDVFDAKAMELLEGRVGIAHCRYPTAGSEGSDEAMKSTNRPGSSMFIATVDSSSDSVGEPATICWNKVRTFR